MALVLNEEQRLVKQTAKSFVQDKAPVKTLRQLRDDNDETGYSTQLWKEMVDMGWAGIANARSLNPCESPRTRRQRRRGPLGGVVREPWGRRRLQPAGK